MYRPGIKSGETTVAQDSARLALGLTLMFAGTSHLTFARKPFRAQVPKWVPLEPDMVVILSGMAEITLGAALAFVPRRKKLLGRVAATFFTAIFPGNIAQCKHRRNAFGLDTDAKRFARLFFQPALVGWALWSTGATRWCSHTLTDRSRSTVNEPPVKEQPTDEPGSDGPPNNEPPLEEPPPDEQPAKNEI